jgi:Cu(I)/Ag(I) efflux system membrane fusion protein
MARAEGLKAVLRSVAPAVIAVAVVIAFLLAQHLRDAWPFSLHHGVVYGGMAAPRAVTEAAAPEAAKRARVQLEEAKLASFGIRVEEATLGVVSNAVRAVATVVPDESRVSHVHTRVAGWLEKLYVNTTGQSVKAGDALAGIFSQELFASQVEYLAALKAAQSGPASLVGPSARTRLTVLGMSEPEIRALERRGIANRLVTLVAPRTGVVLRRGVAVGTAVDPSTEIVTVADLSFVWVLAEVTESDASAIRVGSPAKLEFSASGLPQLEAKVEFIYPTLTDRTRTLRVRFVVPNPDGSLRPGLYGTADFRLDPRQQLTVSRDAVVDTGVAQHVFVMTAPGEFEPRTVRLGTRLTDRVEILEGLDGGEQVVASGVFLIDSESRLRASSGGTGHTGHGGTAKPREPAEASAPDAGVAAHQGHGG